MNRILLFSMVFAFTSLTFQGFSQKAKKTEPVNASNSLSNNIKAYKNALSYNDLSSAIVFSLEIIAEEGDKSTFKDSLASLYFQTRNYVSCHLICKEILSVKTNDTASIAMDAFSLKNLNAKIEAIDAFTKLFQLTQNQYYGYELAKLQYEVTRMAESAITIDRALSAKPVEATVAFDVNEKEYQKVPLNAALYNLKGLVMYGLKDEKAAKEAFDKALSIMPEFEIAKQNRGTLDIKK